MCRQTRQRTRCYSIKSDEGSMSRNKCENIEAAIIEPKDESILPSIDSHQPRFISLEILNNVTLNIFTVAIGANQLGSGDN